MTKESLKDQAVAEKRIHPRTRLQTTVNLFKNETETQTEGVSENYSLTGLFLKINEPDALNVDDVVEVSFKDENGNQKQHTGKVIRKNKTGIAIFYWRDQAPPPIV